MSMNDVSQRGITFVDYKMLRKNDVLIMDEELTLEQLQINLGDALEVKQSDTGQVYFQIKEINCRGEWCCSLN